MNKVLFGILSIIILGGSPLAFADSETDMNVDAADSETDMNVDAADSETDMNVDDADSETDMNVDDADSETDMNVDDADSETDMNVDDADSETDMNVDAADSETDMNVDAADSEKDMNVDAADSEKDMNVEFAMALEETLVHFRALEMNLDESNSELALVHAIHPISELYETMSLHLETNTEFNEKLKQTLLELKNDASTSVDRDDAQSAIDNAKEVIQEARDIVIGDEYSNDSGFKAQLIKGLLETSKVEYQKAIEDGEIIKMAEFQDSSAFVWRSQQIFEEIRSDVGESDMVSDTYAEILKNYDQRETFEDISLLVDEIIAEIEMTSKVKSKEPTHMDKVSGADTPLKLDETIQMDSSTSNKEDYSKLTPLKQIKKGVEPKDIQCKPALELIFKISGEPACVKPTSVQKLIGWGWAQ